MREPLSIAAVQPACRALDGSANALAHAEAVRAADARVVVFPELSLTGYELAAVALRADDGVLAPIVDACAEAGAVALVGAPVVDVDGREFIAMLHIDSDGSRLAYRKSWLAEVEARRFAAGDGPKTLEIDGWRLGSEVGEFARPVLE